jgi:uncharacterized protein
MKVLFADTSGWMSCADAKDPYHNQSLAAKNDWLLNGGTIVTTDYVVDETLTLLRMRLSLNSAKVWWETISSSARVQIIHLNGDFLESARLLFFGFKDKEFSFTDCTSFALMKRQKIRIALTTDHHFSQAGFQCLPGK